MFIDPFDSRPCIFQWTANPPKIWQRTKCTLEILPCSSWDLLSSRFETASRHVLAHGSSNKHRDTASADGIKHTASADGVSTAHTLRPQVESLSEKIDTAALFRDRRWTQPQVDLHCGLFSLSPFRFYTSFLFYSTSSRQQEWSIAGSLSTLAETVIDVVNLSK